MVKRRILLEPDDIYKTTQKTIGKIESYQWKYRNLLLLALSFVLAYYMFQNPQIISFIENLGAIGYPAAFIAGLLFSYGATTAPSIAIFFSLAHTNSPLLLAIIGAAGSLLGNYIIFKFVRDNLIEEINTLSKEVKTLTKPVSALFFWEELRIRIWKAISKSKLWQMFIPVIAGFILASPLPDEIGVAMFGAVKFDPKKFMIISYVLHFIGILAVVYSSRVIG